MVPTPSHLGVTQAPLNLLLCPVFSEFGETLICRPAFTSSHNLHRGQYN